MGSSKLSRRADGKKVTKLFGSLPWCAWCQAGETCTLAGFIVQPWLFPHGTSQRLLSASGTAPTLTTSGTQRTARGCAGWMGSNMPDLSTACLSPCTFSCQLFEHSLYKILSTGNLRFYNASHGPKYLKYPVKYLSLLVLKGFFPQQLFKRTSSDFKSEWIYYWNYALKSAKIYVLVRLKTSMSYKTFQFWFSTQTHCSTRPFWCSSSKQLGASPLSCWYLKESFNKQLVCQVFWVHLNLLLIFCPRQAFP